ASLPPVPDRTSGVPGRRIAGRQQHHVALAQRNVEDDSEFQNHLAARPRTATFEEADVSLRDTALARQPKLGITTLVAPVAQCCGEIGKVAVVALTLPHMHLLFHAVSMLNSCHT